MQEETIETQEETAHTLCPTPFLKALTTCTPIISTCTSCDDEMTILSLSSPLYFFFFLLHQPCISSVFSISGSIKLIVWSWDEFFEDLYKLSAIHHHSQEFQTIFFIYFPLCCFLCKANTI